MLKVGDLIDGKYKILNEIGRGGMSTVYLAINEKAMGSEGSAQEWHQQL